MTIRVGFLGGGFIAHYHGKMLHTSGADVEIALVHDPDPAKEAAFVAASVPVGCAKLAEMSL